MVDDELLEEQIQIEKACNLADCSQIPPTNLMKIKVYLLLSNIGDRSFARAKELVPSHVCKKPHMYVILL